MCVCISACVCVFDYIFIRLYVCACLLDFTFVKSIFARTWYDFKFSSLCFASLCCCFIPFYVQCVLFCSALFGYVLIFHWATPPFKRPSFHPSLTPLTLAAILVCHVKMCAECENKQERQSICTVYTVQQLQLSLSLSLAPFPFHSLYTRVCVCVSTGHNTAVSGLSLFRNG